MTYADLPEKAVNPANWVLDKQGLQRNLIRFFSSFLLVMMSLAAGLPCVFVEVMEGIHSVLFLTTVIICLYLHWFYHRRASDYSALRWRFHAAFYITLYVHWILYEIGKCKHIETSFLMSDTIIKNLL